ncbi:MAG TPA: 23S rRNA (uracil(1939)-C(5))-methyltransferase RlmD [Bacteroidales bacterium]|nr:23S rRNA (uracil(1939)-C(5))-methyltransferase RlmD [Bacteroidales bacterium]
MHPGGRAFSPDKVYVSGGIPGEEVEIVKERRKGFRCGRVTKVLAPSPYRTLPFCPHAEECGGCPWQHISYEGQLLWKKEILLGALRKYEIPLPPGGVPDVLPSPLIKGYRNKAEYTFEAGTPGMQEHIVGFHSTEDRNNVFDCRECSLLPENMHKLALQVKKIALEHNIPFYQYAGRTGLLRNVLLRCTTEGDLCVVPGFSRRETGIIEPFMKALGASCPGVTSWYYCADQVFYYFSGDTYLHETSLGFEFFISPAAFYQPNPRQANRLYGTVLEMANKALATDRNSIPPAAPIFDLYTGIGTIACMLAGMDKDRPVTGIEGNATAVGDAVKNASRNGLRNVYFITGDILETYTAGFVAGYSQPALVVLDPPRSGTLTEIKKAIIASQTQYIIYVSCNPVSLAWDLKQLCEGGYAVKEIRPLDMFPHTQHVETVVLCSRKDP